MTDRSYALSKLGNVTDKARRTAAEVFDAAQAAGHDVWFVWGDGAEMDHKLNHTEGKPVLDFMVHNKAAGDWVRGYMWTHRARLGLKHVIWWQKITSTVNQPGVVRDMEDRGNPTANHRDHVHSEQFAGAYVAPQEEEDMNADQNRRLFNLEEFGSSTEDMEDTRKFLEWGKNPGDTPKIVPNKFVQTIKALRADVAEIKATLATPTEIELPADFEDRVVAKLLDALGGSLEGLLNRTRLSVQDDQ